MSDPTFSHDFSLTFSVRSPRAQASELTDQEVVAGFMARVQDAVDTRKGTLTPRQFLDLFQHVETTSLDAP